MTSPETNISQEEITDFDFTESLLNTEAAQEFRIEQDTEKETQPEYEALEIHEREDSPEDGRQLVLEKFGGNEEDWKDEGRTESGTYLKEGEIYEDGESLTQRIQESGDTFATARQEEMLRELQAGNPFVFDGELDGKEYGIVARLDSEGQIIYENFSHQIEEVPQQEIDPDSVSDFMEIPETDTFSRSELEPTDEPFVIDLTALIQEQVASVEVPEPQATETVGGLEIDAFALNTVPLAETPLEAAEPVTEEGVAAEQVLEVSKDLVAVAEATAPITEEVPGETIVENANPLVDLPPATEKFAYDMPETLASEVDPVSLETDPALPVEDRNEERVVSESNLAFNPEIKIEAAASVMSGEILENHLDSEVSLQSSLDFSESRIESPEEVFKTQTIVHVESAPPHDPAAEIVPAESFDREQITIVDIAPERDFDFAEPVRIETVQEVNLSVPETIEVTSELSKPIFEITAEKPKEVSSDAGTVEVSSSVISEPVIEAVADTREEVSLDLTDTRVEGSQEEKLAEPAQIFEDRVPEQEERVVKSEPIAKEVVSEERPEPKIILEKTEEGNPTESGSELLKIGKEVESKETMHPREEDVAQRSMHEIVLQILGVPSRFVPTDTIGVQNQGPSRFESTAVSKLSPVAAARVLDTQNGITLIR